MKKISLLCICMLLLLFVAGCGKEESKTTATEKAIKITDMTGREVTLKGPVKTYALSTIDLVNYIIPLKGEKTFEMLVGVGDSGGKSSYDRVYGEKFPQWKDNWTVISPHNSPFDVERILAKKPDVLIVNSAMQAHLHAKDIEKRLKDVGIEIILIDVPKETDKSAQEVYKLMGQIFKEEEKAAEVIAFLDKQFKNVKEGLNKVKGPKPLVYYEKSGSSEVWGPSSLSKSSGWGALISYAGGENLADQAAKGKEVRGGIALDPEFILTKNPDFIILSGASEMGMGIDMTKEDPRRFDVVKRAGWSSLKAVEQRNVVEFQHELNRTPFLFYPALSMAKMFYPEAFKDINPEARLEEFYKKFMIIEVNEGLWKVTLK